MTISNYFEYATLVPFYLPSKAVLQRFSLDFDDQCDVTLGSQLY